MEKIVPLILISFVFLTPSNLVSATPTTRDVELVEQFTPKLSGGTGDLYVPLPQEGTNYQKILSEDITGNQDSAKIETVAVDGNKDTAVRILHAHWNRAKSPDLKIVQKLRLSDRESPEQDAEPADYFLKPSAHVQTDGLVLKTAKDITQGLTGNDEKARAIYEWIVDHTLRDPETRGCGMGDVKSLLSSGHLQGKCADINSLFVGLARAVGIPAREVWGLRVSQAAWQKVLGKEGDVSKAQHCRAEYFSESQKGWVAVDPADVRKLILDGKLSENDPDVKRMRHTLFGNWEGNWVAFNYARDFRLPGQKKKINYFMYPQLVSGDSAPDGMDPAEISYTLTSRALP